MADGVVVGSALVDALGARRRGRGARASSARCAQALDAPARVASMMRPRAAAGGPLRPGPVAGRRGASRCRCWRWTCGWLAAARSRRSILTGARRSRCGRRPVRLSKYSYLTQSGVAALVGAVVRRARAGGRWRCGSASSPPTCSGSASCLAPGFINAGREVLGFAAAYGPYAAVLALTGRPDALARSAAGRRDPRLPVLLRHAGAVLLHPARARQARVRREDPDPPLGDHLLPADASSPRS